MILAQIYDIVCFMDARKKKLFKIASIVFVICLVALRLALIYFPFRFFDYLVPPGDDPVNHYQIVKSILGGSLSFSYPPLFHIIIAWLSKIFSQDPMTTMRLATPALVILPSIAVLIVASKFFGRAAGLLSFVVVLWASNYGLAAFGDGNYPNIIAGGFLLPLAFLYLVRSLQEKKKRNYIAVFLLVLLMVFTHHLSTAMFVAVVFAVFVSLIAWNLYEKILPRVWKTFVIFVGVTLGIAFFLYLSPAKTVFIDAFKSFGDTGKVLSTDVYSKPVPLDEYPTQSGSLAWYFGLFALLYSISLLLKKADKRNDEKIAIIGLVAWFVIIFLASRATSIGLPGRFARECYLPLAILTGLTLRDFLAAAVGISKKAVFCGVFGLIIVSSLVQVNGGQYRSPEFYGPMIRFSWLDKEKSDYIKELSNPEDKIIANPTTPYLPIFSERKIEFVSSVYITDQATLWRYLRDANPRYIFIGKKTAANPDEKVYPFFANFDEITDSLNQYAKTNKLTVAKEFDDGSVLYIYKIPKSPTKSTK